MAITANEAGNGYVSQFKTGDFVNYQGRKCEVVWVTKSAGGIGGEKDVVTVKFVDVRGGDIVSLPVPLEGQYLSKYVPPKKTLLEKLLGAKPETK